MKITTDSTPTKNAGYFTKFAKEVACWSGQPITFCVAFSVVLMWAVTGPLFNFSDTWQLIINTGTTIITFLMVFLIQNTQNRDATAMQLKLDELIRALKGAHTAVMDIEELSSEELDIMKEKYAELAERGRKKIRRGSKDTGAPAIKENFSR